MRLLMAPTPNGWKVSIMIEELRGLGHPLPDLAVEFVNIMKGEQFGADFMKVSPNQKIPALEDEGFCLMESCAILEYLGEKFPSTLLPLQREPKFEVLQWVYWQAANVGPVFGNKLSYTRYMDDVDAAAKAHPMERFAKEAQRLMSVLSRRLDGRDFVCGNEFTIADIALYPWVRGWKWSKIPIVGIPNIEAWVDRVRTRPGVDRGLAYGIPREEIDQWSEARKNRTAAGGSVIAANANLERGSTDRNSDT
ncbi:glutathione S-transferase C-terminal domain-containing protein [Myxococcota bacterium]|nr:glutathione S-transferase C-terminal domain-containing protein [Myxococcota bacterium]